MRDSAQGQADQACQEDGSPEPDRLQPGDVVEFWSGDRGGCWKVGTVVEVSRVQKLLRIHVGNGVHVWRRPERCRRARTDAIQTRVQGG